jgi:capsular polysaccharide biosynthesis protein/Mrp family chromosome partitioning ATPase
MNEPPEAPSVFAPLWRRKWLILLVAVLVAAGTYVYYKRQPHVYGATTELFLGSGAEEQAQLGTNSSVNKKANAVNSATAGALINSNVIKEAVKKNLRREKKTAATRAALKGKASATVKEKSQFLTIEAKARRKRAAALLANLTAQTYISHQSATHRRAVETAISLTRRQLRRIEASQALSAVTGKSKKGQTASEKAAEKASEKNSSRLPLNTGLTLQQASLNARINQLEAALYVKGVKQLNPAKASTAKLISPKPEQNAIFGFAIGLVLACFAAYALGRFDRRLRSLAAIERAFQAQILTALPIARRPIVSHDGVPAPSRLLREPLRRLQAGVTLAPRSALGDGVSTRPRSLLFVSADPGDGKSTVAAGLSLVQREAGERVTVVEADFRRPVLGQLLKVQGSAGLADVIEGRISLAGAMQRVGPIRPAGEAQPEGSAPGGVATLVGASDAGSVSVLLGGGGVNDPPALLARPSVAETLGALAEESHHVLVDGPAPLGFTDVLPLLGVVEGVVIVARVGHTTETSAQRLVQLLARSGSAPVLGVVANAVPKGEISKYGLGRDGGRPWHRRLLGR